MASEKDRATDAPVETPKIEMSAEEAVEHARRAFALKQYEKAVDYYATALESITKQHGDDAPETADLYFYYGKALLENAISQNSVLGKEQQPEEDREDNKASGSGIGGSGPIISFQEYEEEAEESMPAAGEDTDVDMFGDALKATAEDEAEGGGGDDDDDDVDGGDDAEPEDDFNAAWEVLDLARAIYDKLKDHLDESDGDEVKLKLADTYIALGDVSLETEKFDQAITDYSGGLALKTLLLPLSSRQIAEAHYKLSMALDLTPGRLSDAIIHAEKALESVETRLAELRDGLNGQLATTSREDVKKDAKGKEKASSSRLVRDDLVQDMNKPQIEAEIKELEGLREDLALKVEELKTTPSEPALSAPALAAQALDKELNARVSLSMANQAVVNDLTSMVVKKKKKMPQDNGVKRKADDDTEGTALEKKAKLEQ